ncbi:MAG TPA: hypothetical protein VIG62_12555 [Blastocatellia bacterium]|jgi:hypothetical protein
MKFKAGTPILILVLAAAAFAQSPGSPVVKISLTSDRIGVIKVSPGLTTRVVFPAKVKEIICGDLYDPASGTGAFVVQRGDDDLFLKPVATKGFSNLFVKVGEKGEQVYNFDLSIVPAKDAYRIVNVTGADLAAGGSQKPAPQELAGAEAAKIIAAAQQQSDDIVRGGRQQADQLIKQAEQRATDLDRQSQERSAERDRQAAAQAVTEARNRFARAMLRGLKEVKVNNTYVAPRRVDIILDPRILTFDDKAYLRYVMKNNGDKEFTFSALSLEKGTRSGVQIIPAEVFKGKPENSVLPGEMVTGVIIFDSKLVDQADRLTLLVRGLDNAEIARLTIK